MPRVLSENKKSISVATEPGLPRQHVRESDPVPALPRQPREAQGHQHPPGLPAEETAEREDRQPAEHLQGRPGRSLSGLLSPQTHALQRPQEEDGLEDRADRRPLETAVPFQMAQSMSSVAADPVSRDEECPVQSAQEGTYGQEVPVRPPRQRETQGALALPGDGPAEEEENGLLSRTAVDALPFQGSPEAHGQALQTSLAPPVATHRTTRNRQTEQTGRVP